MILDNKQNGLVGDTLKKYLTKDVSLSFVTNNFSIFSYRHLQKELRDIKDVRLLFGSPCFETENPANLLGDSNEIAERNRMQQVYISRKCAEWIESKVDVEEAKVPGAIPTKLSHMLPSFFKIDTPLGSYNPDWAVVIEKDDVERLYFVVETKSSLFTDALRPAEQAKIAGWHISMRLVMM